MAVHERGDARALDRGDDGVSSDPMVVVAEHRDYAVRRPEPRKHRFEPLEITPRVGHEVATQHHEIGLERGRAVGDALKPRGRDDRTVVQIGGENNAVTGELRREAADPDRDFGRLEPGAIPPHERRGQPLHNPANGQLDEPCHYRGPPFPAGRVPPRMEQRPDHRVPTRDTMPYTEPSAALTRRLLTAVTPK